MRIKQSKICAAFSWSPVATNPAMLVSGSIAGAMDDDFSAEANLEIRNVDFGDTTTTDMPVVGKASMPDRVHRLDWSRHGGDNGIIAGAFVDGGITVWSADKILERGLDAPEVGIDEEDPAVLCNITKHTSAVKGLHFNPIQPHILASGGQDKELLIWSLQNPSAPESIPAMAKSTHAAEITDLRWNPKFAHILGTTTAAGGVSVWDLKAKRAALQFQVAKGQQSSANTLAWHPEVSTQMAVARDDNEHVVQIWDLKKAMSPIVELRGHTQGILGLAWCSDDPSLLLSCGRDGRTICWNPTTGEMLGELESQDNWVYDVQWAPKVSAVIGTASFDSSLGIYSAQSMQSNTAAASAGPKSAPKWLSRPCGASFGFGGRIVVPEKNTNNVKIISKTTVNDATKAEVEFREGFATTQLNTPERAEFISKLGYGIVGANAAAAATGNKAPLLQFLGVDPAAVEQQVRDLPSPFNLEESEFEELLSKCVVASRLTAAVDLCLAATRFDDAFAVAQLAGPQELQRVHTAYTENRSNNLRFAHYLGAIMSGDYAKLTEVASGEVPWEEVLALYSSYVAADKFVATCDALGAALEASGKNSAAATCYVCSGNVDAAAKLWTDHTPQKLVHHVSALEQTVSRGCTAPNFAAALASHADSLGAAGDFAGALSYSSRAAQLGNREAAIVADRIQHHVPPQSRVQVAFPFQAEAMPNASTMECQMMANQQTGHAAAAPAPTVAARTQPAHADPNMTAGRQPANTGVPARTQPAMTTAGRVPPPQPGHGGAATPMLGTTAASRTPPHLGNAPGPVSAAALGHTAPAPGPAAPGPAPTTAGAPMLGTTAASRPPPHLGTAPGPVSAAALGQTSPASAAPPAPGPTAPGPAPTPATGAPMLGTTAASRPPPHLGTAPGPVSAAALAPQNTTPTQPATPPVPAAGTPTAPTVSTPTAPAPAPVRPAAKAALPTASSLGDFDASSVSDASRPIVSGVTAAAQKVGDKRKREAIEKAANALFKLLAEGKISEPLVVQLNAFAAALGTPASKEEWRKISTAHWDEIQPFLQIKFL